jgi:hypothetical protein
VVAGLTAAVALALLLGAGVATVFGVSANANANLANEKAEDAEREADRADREAKEAKRLAGKEKKARDEAEKNERTARAAAHAIRMTAVWQAWQQHDLVTAEALLDDVPPAYQQTWEYRHLRQLCRRKALTLKGHRTRVDCVAYSPDGKRIVWGGTRYYGTGKSFGELKVWDAVTGQDLLTLKGHTGWVDSLAYSPDGKRVFGFDITGKLLVWDALTGHVLPNAPARILAGGTSAIHGNRRASADGSLVRIERILTADEQLRLRREEENVQRLLDTQASLEFHSDQAETAEENHWPFAAVFHLDRLAAFFPDQRGFTLQRRAAVLTAALKQTPDDPWAARALARQAIADPASTDRETLLTVRAALARQQDAPNDRLFGALLLRTGSARDAVLVLRAARNKRGPDAPPVEELLLALAHAHRKQPAEAHKHLRAAVAWMQRGSEPIRAASLAGLAARSPLSALAALPLTPPDPRLVPLDHQTAHELTALRAEVEKALAASRGRK